MAESKNTKAAGTFGQRAMVIAFGLAIVAIGAQPFQRKYGGVLPYLRQHSTAFAKESIAKLQAEKGKDRELRSLTLENRHSSKAAPDVGVELPTDKVKKLDKLGSKDRQELDNLLNSK